MFSTRSLNKTCLFHNYFLNRILFIIGNTYVVFINKTIWFNFGSLASDDEVCGWDVEVCCCGCCDCGCCCCCCCWGWVCPDKLFTFGVLELKWWPLTTTWWWWWCWCWWLLPLDVLADPATVAVDDVVPCDCIDSLSSRRMLAVISFRFSSKLWFQGHFLKHLVNISSVFFYYLMLPDEDRWDLGLVRWYAWLYWDLLRDSPCQMKPSSIRSFLFEIVIKITLGIEN